MLLLTEKSEEDFTFMEKAKVKITFSFCLAARARANTPALEEYIFLHKSKYCWSIMEELLAPHALE